MQLLRLIASNENLTELVTSQDIETAEAYERRGWVVLRRMKPSKSPATYGHQTVYAHITDAGRSALAQS